jgi:hypothetical protein
LLLFGKRLSEILDCFFVDSFLPGALLGLEGACGRLEVLDQQLPKLRQLQSLVLVVLVRVVLEVSHLQKKKLKLNTEKCGSTISRTSFGELDK